MDMTRLCKWALPPLNCKIRNNAYGSLGSDKNGKEVNKKKKKVITKKPQPEVEILREYRTHGPNIL